MNGLDELSHDLHLICIKLSLFMHKASFAQGKKLTAVLLIHDMSAANVWDSTNDLKHAPSVTSVCL